MNIPVLVKKKPIPQVNLNMGAFMALASLLAQNLQKMLN